MSESSSVLFICTYNSVRSQLAEGVCRTVHQDWDIFSAGVAKGYISQNVVRVLEEEGVDTCEMHSKHLTDLSMNEFDVIVVLCENAWRFKNMFPSAKQVIFYPVRSPELSFGEDELSEFRRCFCELKSFCESL